MNIRDEVSIKIHNTWSYRHISAVVHVVDDWEMFQSWGISRDISNEEAYIIMLRAKDATDADDIWKNQTWWRNENLSYEVLKDLTKNDFFRDYNRKTSVDFINQDLGDYRMESRGTCRGFDVIAFYNVQGQFHSGEMQDFGNVDWSEALEGFRIEGSEKEVYF